MTVKACGATAANAPVEPIIIERREPGAHDVRSTSHIAASATPAGEWGGIIYPCVPGHETVSQVSAVGGGVIMSLVGVPEHPYPSPTVGALTFKRRAMAGSLIGSSAEMQEMLDLCAEHGGMAGIEMIRLQDIDAAYDRRQRSDVKYRFVIDNATLEG